MRRIISAVKRGNRLRFLALSVLVVAVLVGTTGCYSKLNGGGWMQSANGESRATFGITYDGDLSTARGTNQDKAAGVSLKFSYASREWFLTQEQMDSDCAYFDATYQSQNKKKPGSGIASLVACDNGEPGFRGDTLSINVEDGPYLGYTNSGPILGGNLQGLEQVS